MALNIKNEEAERLAAEVAELAGESKTGAVKVALRERRDRLQLERGALGGGTRDSEQRTRDFLRFLETEIWPLIPEEERGKPPLTKAEKEEILGYGPGGV